MKWILVFGCLLFSGVSFGTTETPPALPPKLHAKPPAPNTSAPPADLEFHDTAIKRVMQSELEEIFNCYKHLQKIETGGRGKRIDQFAIVPSSTLGIEENLLTGKILRIRESSRDPNGHTSLTLSFDTFEIGPVPKGVDSAELSRSRTQKVGNLALKNLGINPGQKIKLHDQVGDEDEQQTNLSLFRAWLINDIAGSSYGKIDPELCPDSIISRANQNKEDRKATSSSTNRSSQNEAPSSLEKFLSYGFRK